MVVMSVDRRKVSSGGEKGQHVDGWVFHVHCGNLPMYCLNSWVQNACSVQLWNQITFGCHLNGCICELAMNKVRLSASHCAQAQHRPFKLWFLYIYVISKILHEGSFYWVNCWYGVYWPWPYSRGTVVLSSEDSVIHSQWAFLFHVKNVIQC